MPSRAGRARRRRRRRRDAAPPAAAADAAASRRPPPTAASRAAPDADAASPSRRADRRPPPTSPRRRDAAGRAATSSDSARGWAEVVAHDQRPQPRRKPLIIACRPIGVEGNVVTLGFPEEQGFLQDVAERRRPLLEEGIGESSATTVAVRCVATNLDLLPPLPADADAAHILAEAHRIFAEDLADVAEVS